MSYLLPDEAITADHFNAGAGGFLPGHLGITITHAARDRFEGRFTVTRSHLAPNGFLHAGAVVTLLDSLAGFATISNAPAGASGFTTIELKSNFFATALEGEVLGIATPVHVGRTTQVWDAEATSLASGKRLALFRCSQLILYPK